MARIINRVPFHWAQSARQRPHYPVDNWSVLPFISILNAIKCHHWLSNLPSALGSGCLLRQANASQIRAECSVRWSQRRPSHHTLIFSTWLLRLHLLTLWPRRLQHSVSPFTGPGWERWVYQMSSAGSSPAWNHSSWGPENVILVRWCHRRCALVGHSGN